MEDDQIVLRIADQYRQQGYTVTVRPRDADLPPFLGTFQPDLIARGPSGNVVVEIKGKSELANNVELSYVAGVINAQPGWRFDLIVADDNPWPDQVSPKSAERTPEEIGALAAQVSTLMAMGSVEAACLVAWSAVEAALRHLAAAKKVFIPRKDPRSLIRALYTQAVITREQLDQLENAMRVRNALAHGLKPDQFDVTLPSSLASLTTYLLAA